MAEQTFNAVERVDEYCHLPEEAAYEFSPGKKAHTSPGRRNSSSGGPGGSATAATRKPRSKAGADGLREPLLPVTSADARGGAGGSSSSTAAAAAGQGAGPLVVVDGVAPEGWPREGSIEFSDVKMR